MSTEYHPLEVSGWEDYQLLDSGEYTKLESFGSKRIIRPEKLAHWSRRLPGSEWEGVVGEFILKNRAGTSGVWVKKKHFCPQWEMCYKDLRFEVQIENSRQVGVFPEQAAQWDWIVQSISKKAVPIHIINLFGYTGIASLAACNAGAKVTHVDSSKKAVNWAKRNQVLSKLDQMPIRWIVDDVLKFINREIKRGNKYDAIIMDPPKFGRGPSSEVWEINKMLPDLLQKCRQLLSEEPVFFVITTYTNSISATKLNEQLMNTMELENGHGSYGEIIMKEKSGGRKLPLAAYSRWRSGDIY